jgi:hypothetical protein
MTHSLSLFSANSAVTQKIVVCQDLQERDAKFALVSFTRTHTHTLSFIISLFRCPSLSRISKHLFNFFEFQLLIQLIKQLILYDHMLDSLKL